MMMAQNPNDQTGVGQGMQYNQPTEKYDAEHGKYEGNVPRTGGPDNFPNLQPAGPDPNPFKVGGV
jgi:hypothetical protein